MPALVSEFSLLIVDDEPAIIAAIKRLFYKDKLNIYSAASGLEALSIINRKRIDGATIDLKMEPMGGLELLQKIKKMH